MKQVFLAFTVVLAVFADAAAPAKAEPIVTYALDNGLRVVLVPDHRAPKVVMNLRYGVGSIVVAGDPDVVIPQLAAIGLKDVQVVKREETEGQTAMRTLDLLGDKRQAPLSASPWRVGDGGTTRAVHSCAGDRDCGAQIHAD